MNRKRKYGLEPLFNAKTEIIIIGTLPGAESLIKRQYYADPDNQFWDIIYRIFNEQWAIDHLVHELIRYEKRCKFLLVNNIGLWDIIKSAIRDTSSDSRIKDPEFNDFHKFLSENINIKLLVFNGQKSFKYLKKQFPEIIDEYGFEVLNSTSPQNSKNTFYKIREWKGIINKAT